MASDSKELEEQLKGLFFSNCEFIIYDTSKKDFIIEDSLKDQIYHLLMTYRFPMRMNPRNSHFVMDLSEQEKRLLDSNEYLFIVEQLKKLNPDLKIIPIPKTLYQVFFLMMKLEHLQSVHYSGDDLAFIRDWNILLYVPGDHSKEKSHATADETSDDYNLAAIKEAKETFFQLNIFFLQFIQRFIKMDSLLNPGFTAFENQDLEYLCNVLLQQLTNLNSKLITDKKKIYAKLGWIEINLKDQAVLEFGDKTSFLSGLGLPKKVDTFLRVLKTIIYKEWATRHIPNIYNVYRGCKSLGSDIAHNSHTNKGCHHSLSFSDGLLSGILFESRFKGGATAFDYLLRTKQGYLIPLPMQFLLSNECPFYVPPVPHIVHLQGSGELFHVRTRYTSDVPIGDVTGGIQAIVDKSNLGCLVSKSNLNAKLFLGDFLREHAETIDVEKLTENIHMPISDFENERSACHATLAPILFSCFGEQPKIHALVESYVDNDIPFSRSP